MNNKLTELLDRMTGIIAKAESAVQWAKRHIDDEHPWLACDALVKASNYIDDAMGEWQQAVERDERLADPYADAP